MTEQIVVLSTCSSMEEGERLARALVTGRLAACVNLLTGIKSVYRWKSDIETAEECLLVIKSSRGEFDRLRAAIEKLHSYEVPEIIALPVIDGAPNYLSWLAGSVGAEPRA